MFIERATLHEIADLVTRLLNKDGYECIDADWTPQSRTLRVFIDHPNGIDLDECSKISNVLVESSDLDTALPFDFNLEVSSPGIERPLRTLDHFKRAQIEGTQIDVKLTEKYKNRRNGKGVITSIDQDQMISMATAEGAWAFPWSLSLKATKVVDWNKIQGRAE